MVSTIGLFLRRANGIEPNRRGDLTLEVDSTRGFRICLNFEEQVAVDEWCGADLVAQSLTCLTDNASVEGIKIKLRTDDANLFIPLYQKLVNQLQTDNRTIETLVGVGEFRGSLGPLLEQLAQSAAGRRIEYFMVGRPVSEVRQLVTFLEALEKPMVGLCMHFLYEPERLRLFNKRSSFAHLWGGFCSSRLDQLQMSLTLSDSNAKFDEEDLTPAPSLKLLTLEIDAEGEDSLLSSEGQTPSTAASGDQDTFYVALKLFLSCESLETFCYREKRKMLYAELPEPIRKQVFLDYCAAMANSQTVESAVLPFLSAWWRDEECLERVVQMVRTNTRLINFRTGFSEGDFLEMEEARREIDFWLWMNAKIDEEKLLKGTTPRCLWPFLIERLMSGEEPQEEEDVLRKRTACYQLLKQRIDLLAYNDGITPGKRKRM